jgi:hypothetical protein
MTSTLKFYVSLLWLTCAATIVPAYAIMAQYQTHAIKLVAGAEDDCNYYYGAYALSDVQPMESMDGRTHYVLCVYR